MNQTQTGIDMKDVRDYTWEDFKLLWESFEKVVGKDEAWKMLHATWQLRAGELSPEDAYAELLGEDLEADEDEIVYVEFAEWHIELLNISNRTLNCLKKEGIILVKDLKNYTFDDLKKIKHVGSKALAEIIESLKDSGIELLQSKV